LNEKGGKLKGGRHIIQGGGGLLRKKSAGQEDPLREAYVWVEGNKGFVMWKEKIHVGARAGRVKEGLIDVPKKARKIMF